MDDTKKALLDLIPIEKLEIETTKAIGFNERVIHILRIRLRKQRNINVFLKWFVSSLASSQKQLLVDEVESRIDERLDFFVRLDKQGWMSQQKVWLTESGQCFHIRISLAVFPRKRELAVKLIQELLQKNF